MMTVPGACFIPKLNTDPYYSYLVLWMDGTDFTDKSQYNTTIEENTASIGYGGYDGDGSSSFETGSHADNFQLFTGPFTIVFSIKRKSGNYGAVVGKWRYNDIVVAVPNGWLISMSISGPMRFSISGGFNMNGTIPPADGAFHICKYTFDGSTLSYYLDGVLDAYASRSTFSDTVVDIGIMAEDSSPGVPFLGYGSASADYKCVLGYLKIYKGVAI